MELQAWRLSCSQKKKEYAMGILALVILILSLASAYLGFYHFTDFEADAARGAALIGLIIFVVILIFGRRKS
jgi:uncharacterized membrane protein YtjA (UPF0391 family)